MATLGEVSSKLATLYGAGAEASMVKIAGSVHGLQKKSSQGWVLHSVAAWRSKKDGRLRIIKIIPGRSPSSKYDWFVFNCARSRASTLLTTGMNLSAEPWARHDEWGTCFPGLAKWRSESLAPAGGDAGGALTRPPNSVVVTTREPSTFSSHGLVRDNTVFYVKKGVNHRQHDGGKASAHTVVSIEGGIREVVCHLSGPEASEGPTTVLIEAGGIAQELYPSNGSLLVDEMVLSIFEGDLAEDLVGNPLALDHEDAFADLFENRQQSEGPLLEESGPWRFFRFWGKKT